MAEREWNADASDPSSKQLPDDHGNRSAYMNQHHDYPPQQHQHPQQRYSGGRTESDSSEDRRSVNRRVNTSVPNLLSRDRNFRPDNLENRTK